MISLIAVNKYGADIEVGRFGLSLEKALNWFLGMCESNNVSPAVSRYRSGAMVTLPFVVGDNSNMRLIDYLAHGVVEGVEAPTLYQLKEVRVPPAGEYVRTGQVYSEYCDA
jgi:hypothetical protein